MLLDLGLPCFSTLLYIHNARFRFSARLNHSVNSLIIRNANFFSCELFISCITCDFIISLHCISFFSSFIVSSFIVYCVLCMRVCVCVYGLLPDSNKD